MKILVTESFSQEGKDLLAQCAVVDVQLGLDEDALCQVIGEYDALVVRSATRVTRA